MPGEGTTTLHQRFWITDEIRARRKKAAALYLDDNHRTREIEQLHEQGLITIKPKGERVLLRAILSMDAAGTGVDDYDARQSVAHEIVALGPGVESWEADHGVAADERLRVGQHCFVLSTVADRASKTDAAVRLWFVHVEDISGSWDIPVPRS